jgi:hypothetical protein
VSKDRKVLVACQKGLRSLAACEQLSRAGYTDISWINGGLDNSEPGQVPTVDGKDVRLAGIGGLSEMLGWTQAQAEGGDAMGQAKTVLKLVCSFVPLFCSRGCAPTCKDVCYCILV